MSRLNWPTFTAPVDPSTEGADAETDALSPERALLSPAWIASLAILGLGGLAEQRLELVDQIGNVDLQS